AYAQSNPVQGDFRSIAGGGAWSDHTTWEKYDQNTASWIPAVSGEIPGETNSVFLEENTAVFLENNQSCRNLHINVTSDIDRLTIQNNVLEVWGELRFYSGTAPGINQKPAGSTPGQYL